MRSFAPLPGSIVVSIVLFTLWSAPVSAAPLTLAEAEEIALARDAGRERLDAEADAQAERAIAAGAFPDPQVSLGLQNLPVNSFALDDDPMTMVMLGVEQMFPPSGVRDLSRMRGEHLADATRVMARDRERLVRYQLREAWFMAQSAQALQERVAEVRAATAGLSQAAQSRYATGGGRQSDYLAAKLKLDRLADAALRAEEQLAYAQAMLLRWLGELPTKFATASLPVPGALADLKMQLETHPLLGAAEARIAAGEASEGIAKESFGPSWKIGASYGRRDGIGMAGEPVDDVASIMVGLSVPLFTKNRQERELSAARSETRAARYQREDLLRELTARLDSAWRRHRDTGRQLALYEQQLLPAAEQAAVSTEQAYADNAASFDDFAQAQIDLFEVTARRLELAERVQRARAEILYLTGEAR